MEQDLHIKFCVVGQSGVGKTSMLCQYIHHKFDEQVKSTIGCDFSTKLKTTMEGKNARLQLWDIAGQERFNAVSKMYLRGALGCVMVCSATDEETLMQTLKWKKLVEDNSDASSEQPIPFMLVQNKSDMVVAGGQEKFQTQQYLSQFAKEHGFCGALLTSAKENTNIEQVFQRLLDQVIERGLVKNDSTQKAQDKSQNIKLVYSNIDEKDRKQNKSKKCCK